jgi:hypothetical protein
MDCVHESGWIFLSVNGAFGGDGETERQREKQGEQRKFAATPRRIRVQNPSTAFTIKIRQTPFILFYTL